MIPGGLPGFQNSGTVGDVGGSAGPSSATGGNFGITIGGFNVPSWAPAGGVNTNTLLMMAAIVGVGLYLSRKR